MRRAARAALALQVVGIAVLGATHVAASAQPSPSPSPSGASSSAPAPSQPAASSTTPNPQPTAASASPSPAPASSPALESPSPRPTPTATATPGEPALTVATRSMEIVAQVGDAVRYQAVVANEGDAPAERIFVVGFLPPEVRFVSADLLPEVEATLYNRIGTKESVTWNIGDIAPGDSITLSWAGRVQTAGDMNATSAVTAVARAFPKLRRESNTYLVTTTNLAGANPSPTPGTSTVVTYERVPTGEVLGSAEGEGSSVVPETGFGGPLAVSVGALLVALGAMLWWVTLPGPRRRRRVGLALAVLALLAACTSGRDLERAGPEPTGSPEVKGRRIGPGGEVRDLGQGRGRGDESGRGEDDSGSQAPPDAGDGDGATPAPESEPTEPETTLVARTEVITIDPVIAPPIRLASSDGDNDVSYDWTGSSIGSLASSTTAAPSPVRIETEVTHSDGGLTALVTITNVRTSTPVVVDGRVLYDIGGSAHASLASAPLDVMLMPGGSTTASFTYDLPAGTYSARSFFEAN